MSDHQSVIMSMDQKSVSELKELLGEAEIQVSKAPQTGLLMMVARDPFATDFCLGEILVTEAETEYRGQRGYALVLGEEPEKAMLTAAVAAIFQSDNDALKTEIGQFLAPMAFRLKESATWERRLLSKTQVNFETMVKG